MALKVGDKAPNFELTTKAADGPKKFKLNDNLGKKNTVLLFFPMAFTGVCTKEMCEVSQGLNAYTSLNADVLGISGDNPFAQAAWAEKEKITVPLLADYEHKVAQAYEVSYASFLPEKNLGMGGVPKRSAFVIDKQGIIRYAESNDNPGQMPNFDAIKTTLAQLGSSLLSKSSFHNRGEASASPLFLFYSHDNAVRRVIPTCAESRQMTECSVRCSSPSGRDRLAPNGHAS